MDDFKTILKQVFNEAGIPLTEGQARKMTIYYEYLTTENEKHNLTAIIEPEQAARKHFLDSAMAARLLPKNASVIDVGSGAGFPAVPLKIMRPDIAMTALEATGKKCRFIEAACEAAGVEVAVLNGRAEEIGQDDLREEYDACTSRALAELPVQLELCVPLVRPGGFVIAYKSDSDEELKSAANAMRILAVTLAQKEASVIPGEEKTILVFRKDKETDAAYPRKYAQIKKRPL